MKAGLLLVALTAFLPFSLSQPNSGASVNVGRHVVLHKRSTGDCIPPALKFGTIEKFMTSLQFGSFVELYQYQSSLSAATKQALQRFHAGTIPALRNFLSSTSCQNAEAVCKNAQSMLQKYDAEVDAANDLRKTGLTDATVQGLIRKGEKFKQDIMNLELSKMNTCAVKGPRTQPSSPDSPSNSLKRSRSLRSSSSGGRSSSKRRRTAN